MLSLLKEHWNQFLLFAVSLMTLFVEFVITPPAAGGANLWFSYGKFLVALLTGLWFLPVKNWNSRATAWRWWIAAAFFAVLSTGTFLHYNDLVDRWTVKYFGDQRAVIGQTLTDDAKAFRTREAQRGMPIDDLRLLKSYAGDSGAVWQPEEVSYRGRQLALWYLATLLFLASAVITVAQAAYSAQNTGVEVTPQAEQKPQTAGT